MNNLFARNVRVTFGFFLIRLFASVFVGIIYIFLAGVIQYWFVMLLGESTFNYIVGGLLSLFLGVIICNFIGTLAFMFVKGWHVASLAYVPRIIKSGASAVDVGIRAFKKNFLSFGAVYGVRQLVFGTLKDFKTSLWEITDDIPYASTFRKFANNPIVEYIAGDVLHYAFDAAIFYLVRHPASELSEVPNTILTAAKKYLYCIPSILVTSVQTYVLFRFLPKLLKLLSIVFVFLTQGFVAGIFLTVLMHPLFYCLDNALFDPLTMVAFLSVYSKECEKAVDEESSIVRAVTAILDGQKLDTTVDDGSTDDEIQAIPTTLDEESPGVLEESLGEDVVPVLDFDDELTSTPLETPPSSVDAASILPSETPPSPISSRSSSMRDLAVSIKAAGPTKFSVRPAPGVLSELENMPFADPVDLASDEHTDSTDDTEDEDVFNPFSSGSASSFLAMAGYKAEDLEEDYFGPEGDIPSSPLSGILTGDDD